MTYTNNTIEEPLVSVIVPLHNMRHYLEECIDSAASSTYSNIEIVVVDDGSTDDSLVLAYALAEKWKRRCPVIVIHQQNKGVSAARNTAIANSRGTFILPLDGDDKIAPDFIEKAVSELIKDSQVTVVVPKAELFGEKSGEWVLPEFSLKLLARKNIVCATALYRKTDWENAGGYCEGFNGFEDWDFWISMLKNGGRVVKLDSIGFYYRRRKNSKRSLDRKFKKEMIRMLNERHSDFFESTLGGPLRLHRSLSRIINTLNNLKNRMVPGYLTLNQRVQLTKENKQWAQ